MPDHQTAERRSLRYHVAIAGRIGDEPELLQRARARVDAWLRDGSVAEHYALGWRDLLGGSLESIRAFLVDPSERARAFRQVSPFAGALGPRERWRIWADAGDDGDATTA